MSIDQMNRQDLQVMLDNNRVKARNELQVILNQTRDRLLTQINTYRQVDNQLVRQCIVVAEQAVRQMSALEARTATLEHEVKELKTSMQTLLGRQNQLPEQVVTEVAGSTEPQQKWRFAANT